MAAAAPEPDPYWLHATYAGPHYEEDHAARRAEVAALVLGGANERGVAAAAADGDAGYARPRRGASVLVVSRTRARERTASARRSGARAAPSERCWRPRCA